MRTLEGQVAVVTGASRGIGSAVAERLARDGAAVIVNFASDEVAAAATVAAIVAAGGTALAAQADIGSVTQIDHLFDMTRARFGRLDILVANAGHAVFKPLAETTEADFDRTYAINAKGTFFCMQRALRDMADGGRIVAISTIGTVLNMPGGASYFGSKAAIEQFCRVAAKEVAGRGITVNTISPGFIDTDMLRSMLADAEPAMKGTLEQLAPLSRLGEPSDIADAVAFLVGPDAHWITRQNIAVDGGVISR